LQIITKVNTKNQGRDKFEKSTSKVGAKHG
jgi:hypothetical protein